MEREKYLMMLELHNLQRSFESVIDSSDGLVDSAIWSRMEYIFNDFLDSKNEYLDSFNQELLVEMGNLENEEKQKDMVGV